MQILYEVFDDEKMSNNSVSFSKRSSVPFQQNFNITLLNKATLGYMFTGILQTLYIKNNLFSFRPKLWLWFQPKKHLRL